jgi:urease alpha subunit
MPELTILSKHSGQTRKPTHLTEAQSYLSLALASNLLPSSSNANEPFARATTEDFALDSFQNLLFSIARFKERTGRYPRRVTVVGFGVKRARFETLHAQALRWPSGAFSYVGVDVAGHGDMEVSRAGEVSWLIV